MLVRNVVGLSPVTCTKNFSAQRIASSDASVRADVLLGMDGQPLGIHVLSNEVEQ